MKGTRICPLPFPTPTETAATTNAWALNLFKNNFKNINKTGE